MRDFYPEIEPYDTGFLNVGDGHRLYFSQSGNKKGIPVVYLHGGPGSCTKPKHARFFNPKKYRIILFDQRGCGQSTPFASLKNNTTPHLVADMEKLRKHLGIDKWMIFGGSWGSTLGIAYATKHAKNVLGAILYGIFLGSKAEGRDFVGPRGVAAQIHPEAYHDFVSVLKPAERKDPLQSFAKIIAGPKNPRRAKAMRAWMTWETTLYMMGKMSAAEIKENTKLMEKLGLVETMTSFESSYISRQCYLNAASVLKKLKTLRRVPALIFQGRYDIVCPPQTAWDVHRAWPGSVLTFIEGEGHANDGPKMLNVLIGATDTMAKRFKK